MVGPHATAIVEGGTEKEFVGTVLGPYLGQKGVFVHAQEAITGRKHGKIHTGGMTVPALPRVAPEARGPGTGVIARTMEKPM